MIGSRWLGDIDNSAIRGSDPLGLDPVFRELPAINKSGDEKLLRETLARAAASVDPAALSACEALAAMRDLGVLVSSLRRQVGRGLELSALVVEGLVALGALTGMPPRETVVHYSSWNPAGARRRTFTDDPEEHALISTTALCLVAFENAARALLDVRGQCATWPAYAAACRRAAGEIAVAARAVQSGDGRLDGRHFATHLRAYFEPVAIDGRSYSAAAAAQVPLYLVDECVFGRTTAAAPLVALRDELAEYGLPRWRSAHRQAQQGPSVVETINTATRPPSSPSPAVADAVAAASELTRQLVSFRGRHRRLVAAAYKHAPSDFDNGSAGADLQMIDKLLATTRATGHALPDLLKSTRHESDGTPSR